MVEGFREVLTAADSLWVYPLGALLVALSAFLPPVPSTSIYVALGALSINHSLPNGFLLAVSMLAGAVAGDLAVFELVRRRDIANWRMFNRQGPRKALEASRARMTDNALSWVLTSRFVPLGRLTMNVACAAVPVPFRTFTAYSVAASLLWSAYSVGIGALSGLVPGLSTEWAVLVAIAASLLLGRGISAVAAWYLPPTVQP